MNLSASSHYKHHLNRLSLNSSEQTNSQMNLSKTSHLAPKTETNIFSPALSISSHAFGKTLKNYYKLSKKSLLSRSLNQSDKECKGRTPFQSRKISQKQKANKILQNILARNRQKHLAQESQKVWMMVREITPEKPLRKEEEKDDEHIRQTNITLQEQSEEPFQRYSPHQKTVFDSNLLTDCWIFPNKNQPSSQKKVTNKKMAFKQLWKQRNQALKSDLNSSQISGLGQNCKMIHTNALKNMKDVVLRKGGNLTKCHTQPAEDHQNASIHCKKTRKKANMSKLFKQQTCSAIKILPYSLQNNQQNSKHQSFYSSFSESKIKLIKYPRTKVCPYRSANYLKRQQTDDDSFAKELSAWEINDYSERQTLA